jgi:hypothetical protein
LSLSSRHKKRENKLETWLNFLEEYETFKFSFSVCWQFFVNIDKYIFSSNGQNSNIPAPILDILVESQTAHTHKTYGLLRRVNNACFLLWGNFLGICFGNKVVTACGPGDSVHRDPRGQDAKDLGLGRPDRQER